MVNPCTLVLAAVVLTASSTFAVPVPADALEARGNQVVDAVKNAGHKVKAAIQSPKGQAVVQTVQNVAAVGEKIVPFLPNSQRFAKLAAGADKVLPLAETAAGTLRTRELTPGSLEARGNTVVDAVKNAGHEVKAAIQSPTGQAVVQTVQNVAAVGEKIVPFLPNSQRFAQLAAGADKVLPLAETAAGTFRTRELTFATPGLEARDNKLVEAVKNAEHRAKAAIQSPKGQAVVRTAIKVAAVGQAVAPLAMLVLREDESLSARANSDYMYYEMD